MFKNYRVCFFIIVLLFVSSWGYGKDPGIETLSKKEYVQYLLKTYTKDGYAIVNTYNTKVPSRTRTDFMDYVDDVTNESITSTINTVVHEICHGYTGEFGSMVSKELGKSGTHYYFYINDNNSLLVNLTKTFPSKKMKNEFPETLRTFRFSYIDTTQNNLSTQLHGIYGLLDEYNAYLQGTRAAYDLHPYFMKKENITTCGDYLTGINSTLYGMLEFKFFILKYLLFAEKYEKSVYNGIINNSSFKQAFHTISVEVYSFISGYFKKKEELYTCIKENGLVVYDSDEFLYIGTDTFTTSGYSNFLSLYKLLAREMEKSIYQSLMKRLGVTGKALHFPDIKVFEEPADSSSEDVLSSDFREEYFSYEEISEKDEETADMGGISLETLYPVIPNKLNQFNDTENNVTIQYADITSCSVDYTNQEIILTMNLAQLPEKLKINHHTLNPHTLEYEWSFKIDVNGDNTIELECSVSHAKEEGKKEMLGYPDKVMDTSMYRVKTRTLEYLDIPFDVAFTNKSIIFSLQRKSHPLITAMEDGCHISFSSYFYDGTNYAVDYID